MTLLAGWSGIRSIFRTGLRLSRTIQRDATGLKWHCESDAPLAGCFDQPFHLELSGDLRIEDAKLRVHPEVTLEKYSLR